jgi:putative serine protease PepD
LSFKRHDPVGRAFCFSYEILALPAAGSQAIWVDTEGMSFDSHWANTPPAAPTSRPRGNRVIAVLLVLAMSLGGGVIGGIIGANSSSSSSNGGPLVTAAPIKPENIGKTDIARAAATIAPSIVTIDSLSGEGESVGTGIIVTSDGEILTNNHVVEGSTSVRVRLNGTTAPIMAKVLATDAGNDLALIKLVSADGLTAATFADPESIAVGDPVVAVGYALALDGGPSVTAGIISALNRTLTDDNGALNGLIQTDAAISSGNSGGPLINLNGQVVGINTAVANSNSSTAANNIGFAIGVAEVQRVSALLRADAGGEVRAQGYLGISLSDRNDGGAGAVVSEVQADSPADKAGLKVNDIVLQINGQAITGQGALIAIVRDSAPGDVIKVKVERDGVAKNLTATLVARPKE